VHRVVRRSVIALSVLAVSWGALAFGAVYPWSYYPLAAMCAIAGLTALVIFRPSRAPINALAGGLAVIAVVIALQLVPLSPTTLARVSPGTDRFLRTNDLGYLVPVLDESGEQLVDPAPRPITLDPAATRTAFMFFAVFAVFTLGLAALLSVTGAMPLVHAMVALGVVLALVGIVQYTVTGGATYTLKIYGFWTPEFRGTPFGPYVNRNHFAGWMLMGLPLAIATACGAATSFRGPGLRRFIGWLSASPDAGQMQLMAGASAIMALSLLMASSRSGVLGLGVAALLATGLVLRRQKTRRARGWVLFLAVFLLVAAAGWAGVDALVLRIGTLSADGSSAGGRLQTWKDALTIGRNFPFIGAGVNAFGMAMTQYQTSNRSIHFEQAHNDYLQLLAEGGILLSVAVVATLAIFINTIRRRFREAPRQGSTYWARVGAVIGLIGIAIQSLFEFSLQIPGNAAMFCVLAAIAIHRSPSVRSSGSDPKDINYGYPSHTP